MALRSTSPVATISRLLAWIAGALILVSAFLVSADVITRALFSVTFMHSFELSTFAFAASITFGLSYTLISKSHVRIEVVYNLLPVRVRAFLDLGAITLLAISGVALAWFAGRTVLYTWEIGAHTNTSLSVPLVIPQGLWLAGLTWFALTASWLALRSLAHILSKEFDRVAQEVGVLALQEEISLSATPSANALDTATAPAGGRS